MKYLDAFLSLIYPNSCAFCKRGMPHSVSRVYICSECMERLSFCIRSPRCSRCGTVIGDGRTLCEDCLSAAKSGIAVYYDRITAPLVYDDSSKNAILHLKNGQYLGAVPTFCRLIKAMAENDFKGVQFDFVTAVPMRRERMLRTGFDHADLLAGETAKLLRIKYVRRSMKRVRKTQKQSSLGYADRYTNLNHAFALRKPAEMFRDKTVLVIDDVSTTGSTINECARVLKEAGAKKIYGAVLAKTPKVTEP